MHSPLPRLLRSKIARLAALERRTTEQQASLLRQITLLAQTLRALEAA